MYIPLRPLLYAPIVGKSLARAITAGRNEGQNGGGTKDRGCRATPGTEVRACVGHGPCDRGT